MAHTNWNDWFFAWDWLLWFGFVFLLFLSFGNWGYTYQVHQKTGGRRRNVAFDILDGRYARGEISRTDYGEMKSEIAKE